MSRNFILVFLFFISWFFIILLFLFYTQVLKHKYYYSKSLHLQKISTVPRRGTIYDRNGNILAGSYENYTGRVCLDCENYKFEEEDKKNLKEILNLSDEEIDKAINSKKAYYILKEKVSEEKLYQLEKLKFKGLILEKKYHRYYPYEELFYHLIGFVDWKNDGISGLEYYFNDLLKGKEGEKLILRDSGRYGYDLGEDIKQMVPGKDIKTTLDLSIQYMASKTLDNLKEKIDYQWGAITILNPQNGEILAHSINPPFNLNDKGKWQDEHLASSAYEPGSIMKPFYADTFLRLNPSIENLKFDCSKGYVEIAGVKINDHHRFYTLSFPETLYQSSNVGCILWSLKIPQKEFLKTLENYGFLEKTGIEVPAESRGRANLKNFNILTQAYLTLGQGISVTSAQVLRAYSALINGGYLVKPHLTVINSGSREWRVKPEFEKLKNILFQTTILGTGKKAYLSFLPIAGKTGTAEIAEGGRYLKGSYIGSFVCWYPLENPRYLILIVIYKPRPLYYGGEVAAPLARNLTFYLFLKGQKDENI